MYLLFDGFGSAASLEIAVRRIVSAACGCASGGRGTPAGEKLFRSFEFDLNCSGLRRSNVSRTINSLAIFLRATNGKTSYPCYKRFDRQLRDCCSHRVRSLRICNRALRLIVGINGCCYSGISYPRGVFYRPLSFLTHQCNEQDCLIRRHVESVDLRLASQGTSSLLRLFRVATDDSSYLHVLRRYKRRGPVRGGDVCMNVSSFTCGGNGSCVDIIMSRVARVPVTLLRSEGKRTLSG